jgi:DNA-binding beta-propeller fold protein YncE
MLNRFALSCAVFAIGLAAAAPGASAQPALAVTGKIAGPDGGWDYATFDPVHRRLYVSRTDGVMAVDTDTGKVTAKLVDAQRTHAAVPVNGGDQIVVTSTTFGGVLIADAHTGAVLASIKTGAKPDGAFLEPVTGLVWVMDNAGGGVSLIDVKTRSKVGVIPVEGALESPATDGKGRVFINVEDKNEIAVLDAHTRKVTGHFKLAGCEEPSGLAYSPPEARLVSVCANGVAKVVQAADGKEVASLPIGLRGDTAVYDPKRRVVYVPTGADGKLSLISPATAKVVGVVTTQAGARTQALDPTSGTLYLPAADFAPPAQAGGRPTAIPGTFVVLKVGGK